MVSSLRFCGREPPRSASRCLGFIVSLCFRDPGSGLATGPDCGPCRPQDPVCRDLGLRLPHLVRAWLPAIDSSRVPLIIGVLRVARVFSEGRPWRCTHVGGG